jgi:flagellar biosynthesis component FlhA
MTDIRKQVFLPFFAPLKSSFVRNLITATKYQHCQMQMTRLTILSSLSLFFSLFPSLNFLVALNLSVQDIQLILKERERERETKRKRKRQREKEKERQRERLSDHFNTNLL